MSGGRKLGGVTGLGLGLGLVLVACGPPTKKVRAPDTRSSATKLVSAPLESLPATGSDPKEAPLPMMPLAVTSFGAASDGERVWVFGGYHGEPHNYAHDEQSGRSFGLDPKTGEWVEGVATEGLQSVTLEYVAGRLVRVGGMRAENRRGEVPRLRSVAEVESWVPGTKTWSSLPSLPTPRSSHDTTVVGDELFVVGGWSMDPDTEDQNWATSIEVLDVSDPQAKWRSVQAPFQARALATAAAGNKLVVVGGMTTKGPTSKVHLFDLEAGSWSAGPDFPGLGFGVAAVAHDNEVFATGLEGIVYRLDLASARWVPVKRLLFGRLFPRMVDIGESIHVLGGVHGMTTDDRVRHVESIDVHDGPTPSPRVHRWTLTNPGAAKNRQGMALLDDRLVLIGGNRSLGQHDFEPEHFVNESWELHLTSMRWERKSDFPVARQSMRVHQDGNGLLIAGGFGHGGTAARSFDTMFRYRSSTGQSERLGTTMPAALTQFALARHGEHWWTFGGLDFDAARGPEKMFDHTTAVHRGKVGADLEFDVSKVEMPGTRRAFASLVLGDDLLVVGGMREGFKTVDDCQSFSFATKSWNSMPCPVATRVNADLVEVGGRAYLVGGSRMTAGGLEGDRSIEVFDPKTKTWSVLLKDIGSDPKHMRTLAYGNHLLLFSTHNEDGLAHVALVELGEEV